jgi:ankyrin repeat protein
MKLFALLLGLLLGVTVALHQSVPPEAQAQATQETRFGDALNKFDIDAVRQALKAGADPNERFNRTGLSAISRVASSLTFISSENPPMSLDEAEEKAIAILDVLFQAGAQLRGYDSQILFWPVSQGSKKVTKYLLDRGANPNADDGDGSTPVTLATYYNHPDIVKLLVEYGAKPLDSITSTQIRFVAAAWRGDLIALKRELNGGARVNSQSPNKKTALIEAVSRGHFRVVRELLALGANPNLSGESLGLKSPLHAAVFKGKWEFEKGNAAEIIQLLLKAGAHVSSTETYKQKTPLHIAAELSNPISAKILLDAGAKVMPRDTDGKTPLDYAQSAEVIKLLKSYGAKESP